MMMKWLIIPAFYLLFWGMCFLSTGTDRKNLNGLRSYPDDVQSIVRERSGENVPKVRSKPIILLSNLALFTILFSAIGLIFKDALAFDGFISAFWYFLILGEGLGLFDLVVIDLLWWRNTERIRFSFLPEKDRYQDPTKHIGSFIRGIPLFAVVAVLSAGLVTLF